MLSTPLDLLSLLFVPFIGILVRYRVAYHPKLAPTTDTETVSTTDGTGNPNPALLISNVSPSIEPIPTYRGLWRRVKDIEGWAGLFKGFLPTLLWNIVLPSFWLWRNGTKIYMSPSPTTLGRSFQSAVFYNAFFCIGLIFVYRSITTTHKLELTGTSIAAALCALFTDYERKKPWALWLTPGLAPALIIHIFLQVPVFSGIRRLISFQPLPTYNPVLLACSIGMCLFSTIFLTPLDVIVTRLVIQRNYGPVAAELPTTAPPDVEAQDSEKADTRVVTSEQEADHELLVVRLRKEPYLGLYDCATKIIREEGWQVLYRGWWVTALGNLML